MKGWTRLATITLLGVAFGAGDPGPAQAQEGVAMRDLLGSMGLIEKPRDPITYRERAPLVIPPKAELRPPADQEAVLRHPQWPVDPDVVAAKRKQGLERQPVHLSENRRMSDNNPRLTETELRMGTKAGAAIPTGPVIRPGDNQRDGHWVDPDVLRAQGRAGEAALPAGSSGEPTRTRLSEPPAEYRRSANNQRIRGNFDPILRESDREQASPLSFFRRKADD